MTFHLKICFFFISTSFTQVDAFIFVHTSQTKMYFDVLTSFCILLLSSWMIAYFFVAVPIPVSLITVSSTLIYLGARYSPYTTKVHSSLSSFLPFHNRPFFSRMMSWRRKTLLSSPSLPPPLLLASTSWLRRSTLLMLPNLLTFTWLEPPPSLCSVSWQSWSVSSSKRYSSPCFPHSPVHCQNVIQASLLWYFLSLLAHALGKVDLDIRVEHLISLAITSITVYYYYLTNHWMLVNLFAVVLCLTVRSLSLVSSYVDHQLRLDRQSDQRPHPPRKFFSSCLSVVWFVLLWYFLGFWYGSDGDSGHHYSGPRQVPLPQVHSYCIGCPCEGLLLLGTRRYCHSWLLYLLSLPLWPPSKSQVHRGVLSEASILLQYGHDFLHSQYHCHQFGSLFHSSCSSMIPSLSKIRSPLCSTLSLPSFSPPSWSPWFRAISRTSSRSTKKNPMRNPNLIRFFVSFFQTQQ